MFQLVLFPLGWWLLSWHCVGWALFPRVLSCGSLSSLRFSSLTGPGQHPAERTLYTPGQSWAFCLCSILSLVLWPVAYSLLASWGLGSVSSHQWVSLAPLGSSSLKHTLETHSGSFLKAATWETTGLTLLVCNCSGIAVPCCLMFSASSNTLSVILKN